MQNNRDPSFLCRKTEGHAHKSAFIENDTRLQFFQKYVSPSNGLPKSPQKVPPKTWRMKGGCSKSILHDEVRLVGPVAHNEVNIRISLYLLQSLRDGE